ncbi:MAG: hypothetical protein HY287_00420 [Planctomycetes bacterium]|nr:hypothetical protein [Planctomycetota bacterium]MBI3832777.1 hypothetical protein [Planctomycetota bacterium]
MVVVVSIVLILVTLVLPGMNSLWNQRKLADAENSITGMLMTARAKAMQSGTQGGLFFFVDDRNVQRVVSIVQDPAYYFVYDDPGGLVVATAPDPTKLNTPRRPTAWEGVVLQNVFVVIPERGFEMPTPMRVVPRYVIHTPTPGGGDETKTFNDDELANNSLLIVANGGDGITRQRNFFSVIYSPNGELIVGRDVLVAENDDDKNMLGDITGLPLGVPASVTQYYSQIATATKAPLNPPTGSNPYASSGRNAPTTVSIQFLIADKSSTALNFPSVDGLLVYDDSLFNGAGDAATKRKYLLNSAQPFYIHRLTGAVVRGPLGKNVP